MRQHFYNTIQKTHLNLSLSLSLSLSLFIRKKTKKICPFFPLHLKYRGKICPQDSISAKLPAWAVYICWRAINVKKARSANINKSAETETPQRSFV
jgi:hypothetical protein